MFLRLAKILTMIVSVICGASSATAATYGDENSQQVELPSSFAMRHFTSDVPYFVSFHEGQSALTPNSILVLEAQVAWLMANSEVRITVLGQPDQGDVSPDIALMRSKVVADYLIESGIAKHRISTGVLPEFAGPRATTFVQGLLSSPTRAKRNRAGSIKPGISLPLAPVPVSK